MNAKRRTSKRIYQFDKRLAQLKLELKYKFNYYLFSVCYHRTGIQIQSFNTAYKKKRQQIPWYVIFKCLYQRIYPWANSSAHAHRAISIEQADRVRYYVVRTTHFVFLSFSYKKNITCVGIIRVANIRL